MVFRHGHQATARAAQFEPSHAGSRTPSRTVSAVWTQRPVRSRFRLRAPSGLVLALPVVHRGALDLVGGDQAVGFIRCDGAARNAGGFALHLGSSSKSWCPQNGSVEWTFQTPPIRVRRHRGTLSSAPPFKSDPETGAKRSGCGDVRWISD